MKMTKEEVKKIGFKEIPHYTVMNNLIYELGRGRHLSIGCIGTPNEVLFVCERDKDNPKQINDAVCLHNYDYDGYITEEKLKNLVSGISGK